MCQPGQRILPTTEKVWRVGEEGIFFFVAAAKRLSFFETYIFKRCLVCSGAWHSPNTLPTMVH